MLVNSYLEELLGSRVRVKVLRAISRYETKSFTTRELADFVDVSHTAVLKALPYLQGMNIIRVESHGTSNAIRINRESALYPVLRTLFQSEARLKGEIRDDLRKALGWAKAAAVFGSVARREETLESDIDLLVLTGDKDRAIKAIADIQHGFSIKYGCIISALVMTPAEFRRKKGTPLVKNILGSHIILKGAL
jgi:predicted nucleotidyltransferase